MDKFKVITVFLLGLAWIPPASPAHNVVQLTKIQYGGNQGIEINKTFSGNYGVASFIITEENEVAVLCNVERKIKIFKIDTGELSSDFSTLLIPDDFTYGLDLFFVLSDYHVYVYQKDGTSVLQFPINRSFQFIERLYVEDDALYILSSKGDSYKIYENGLNIQINQSINRS